MVNKRTQAMVGEIEGLELDPLVWQELPQELLERVITKLPFFRVVAFRTVCKHWYLDIIPRVAPNVQASNRLALLYFGFLSHYSKRPKGWNVKESRDIVWWTQVGNLETDWTGPIQEFEHKSFLSTGHSEEARLIICEQGLLFFGFRSYEDHIVRDIFVCNPLTSQSRGLGLPCPLHPPCKCVERTDAEVLVGTVFDAKTGSYCLVLAGVDGTGEYVTFLYDSMTSAWTTGPSLSPAILEVGEGVIDLFTGSSRAVHWNGNLYWYAESWLNQMEESRKYVVKFDIQQGTWRLIHDLLVVCDEDCCSLGACQMALYEGEVMIWHLHRSLYADIYDLDAETEDWPCRSDLHLESAPEIKLMQRHMIERVDGFRAPKNLVFFDVEYLAFSQQNFIYHVLHSGRFVDGRYERYLSIVAQDTHENSFIELPRLPSASVSSHLELSPLNVWSFLPSLTSLP